MRKYFVTIICAFVALFLVSCGGKKKRVTIPYVNYDTSTVSNTRTIDVPFKLESGVKSSIADGSIVEDAIFNIRTLELTDGQQTIVCRNVLTQVSSNAEAPVLLGNGVLDRVASYTIDNEARVIKFKLK